MGLIPFVFLQRGIYLAKMFQNHQHYGVTISVSTDDITKVFLKNVSAQTQGWLAKNELEKVIMVLTNAHSKEVLECWEFQVQCEPADSENGDPNNPTSGKELKRIQQQIVSVMRQILATVSYLPLVDCIRSFDVLTHTTKDCAVPEKWNETNKVKIHNSYPESNKPDIGHFFRITRMKIFRATMFYTSLNRNFLSK